MPGGLDAIFWRARLPDAGSILPAIEALQRNLALGELALEHLDGGLDLELVGGLDLERLVDQLDAGVGVLEVEALRQLP